MVITRHAQERWQERFPNLNISNEFASARYRLSKKERARLKITCPKHTEYCSKAFRGRYMRKTQAGIVFVIAPPETIITVLELRSSE